MKNFVFGLAVLVSGSTFAASPLHTHHGESEGGLNVLIVGETPESVDVSDPSLPPGLTPEIIQKGLDEAVAEIEASGNHADLCLILPDSTAEANVLNCLRSERYQGVVIGAGIRLPPSHLLFFEDVINAVHRGARWAGIAFNVNPKDSANAAGRALAKYQSKIH